MEHSSALILLGMAVIAISQISIGIYAFAGNPIKGIFCAILPLYVFVYARRHRVGGWFMRAWYAGIAIFVVGCFIASA